MSNIKKRVRIFTEEDVRRHARPSDCWVTHKGKVYDVTSFLNDHPGGDDLVLAHAGKDITALMADETEHEHSDSAYEMLAEFQVGIIGAAESTCAIEHEIDEHFQPEDTVTTEDFERNHFLDLNRPLIMQVWNANFSKSFYLQQVHQPRHLPHPARLFGPAYLEFFTRTPWYMVPLIWLPIAAALFWRSVSQQLPGDAYFAAPLGVPTSALSTTMGCFVFGCFVWTILEYCFHRFLFHVDDYLPDRPFFLMLHFLMHGIHHYLPMDGLRLVMPPLLFSALSLPFTRLAHNLFAPHIANGVISGSYTFYVLYDCMHYAFHHTKLPAYLKEMKVYHMAHHFKDYENGFGVTSKFWDIIFGTELELRRAQRVA